MKLGTRFILALLVLAAFYAASKYVELQKQSADMYGSVMTIDAETRQIEVNITGWAHATGLIDGQIDIGTMAGVYVSEGMEISHEDGTPATFDEISLDQSVRLLENDAGEVVEVVLLTDD